MEKGELGLAAAVGGPVGVAAHVGRSMLTGGGPRGHMIRGGVAAVAGMGAAFAFNMLPQVHTDYAVTGEMGHAKVLRAYELKDRLECVAGYDTRVDGASAKWVGKLSVDWGPIHLNTTDIGIKPTVEAVSKNLQYSTYVCFKKSKITANLTETTDHKVLANISEANAMELIVTRNNLTDGIDIRKRGITSKIGAAIADIVSIPIPAAGGMEGNIDKELYGMVDYIGQYDSAEGCLPKALPKVQTGIENIFATDIYKENPFKDSQIASSKDVTVNFVPPKKDQLIHANSLDQIAKLKKDAGKSHVDINFKPPSQLDCGGSPGTAVHGKPIADGVGKGK